MARIKVPLSEDLIKNWHPSKNLPLKPEDISFGSHKKVWWICPKDSRHEWEATANNRSTGNKCPFCSGRRIHITNCLATLEPKIASEWHPTRNAPLTPYDVTRSCNKRVWWLCANGHLSHLRIDWRTRDERECARCETKWFKNLQKEQQNESNS